MTKKHILKRTAIVLSVCLIIIQFFRQEKNSNATVTDKDITKTSAAPPNVQAILARSCYDCHSNNTVYPWYANFQPVAWWLADHINEGKRELNFSTFTTRKIAVQNHKLDEIIKNVKEGEMPLNSYTWIHSDARLTDEQRGIITNWAQSLMDTIKAHYPADSLVLKRR